MLFFAHLNIRRCYSTLLFYIKIGKTHGKKPNEVETKPSNPPPTQEEAKQSFEEPQRSNQNEKKKLNENQQPTTLTNRNSGKRPLSE